MNVSELMTKEVQTCSIHDNLQRAAQIMWEKDCGCVPVVDEQMRVVGILTDRDICMAGYTQGKRYAEIPVSRAMAKVIFTVNESDSIGVAETLMSDKQVRRLPVLDGGGTLRGVISLNDLARNTQPTRGKASNGLSGDTIAQTLSAIGAPRAAKSRQIVIDSQAKA